ncbi:MULTISPECIES: type I-E CRISPR-associated protein Cse2/CasB [Auritidibacter]|uniref:type I-E CRISPR-associated protein Cse2/CasB n=1 Tax=Auritidibacter TaxID=1160973 RepID=UPI000D72D88B|nr:type I-E CRISPR-associated protein Cse2/CasB [Auritidibacter sp. NML130574]AXR74412.1 type I-E CRISPR-associated protein Cse2/CasB [Auritidibacter sp. NML130574]
MTEVTESRSTSEETETTPTVYKAVSSAAYRLGSGLLGNNPRSLSHSRATLARLRRAAGEQPGENPMSWATIAEEVLMNLPESAVGKGPELSTSEWAAAVSISMFALHQQSERKLMHEPGIDLGRAVGTLAQRAESGSIKGRLDALMVARDPKSLQYHLRALVSLLNAHHIPQDYGRLAEDLIRLRLPKRRQAVLVQWGRSYARALRPQKQDHAN